MNYLLFCFLLVTSNFMNAGEDFFDFVGRGFEKIEQCFDKNFPSCKPYKKHIVSGIAVALVAAPLLYFSRSYLLNSNSKSTESLLKKSNKLNSPRLKSRGICEVKRCF